MRSLATYMVKISNPTGIFTRLQAISR